MINLTIFKIKFSVSVGFVALIAFMLYVDKTGLMLPVLEAVALHEAGHLAVMCLLGCRPERVCLKAGAASMDSRLDCGLRGEALISFSGPLVNLLFAQVFGLVYYYSGSQPFLMRAAVMLVMGLFNLLPVHGLDGGTLLYCLLAGRLPVARVTFVVRLVSVLCCAGLLAFGICIFIGSGNNPSMIIMAIYLLVCTRWR